MSTRTSDVIRPFQQNKLSNILRLKFCSVTYYNAMTSSDDMLYCYLLDIVSHLQPLSHRCQLSFKASRNMCTVNRVHQKCLLSLNSEVYGVRRHCLTFKLLTHVVFCNELWSFIALIMGSYTIFTYVNRPIFQRQLQVRSGLLNVFQKTFENHWCTIFYRPDALPVTKLTAS